LCDKSEAAQKANDDERRRWRRSHKNAAIYLLIYAQQWEVGGVGWFGGATITGGGWWVVRLPVALWLGPRMHNNCRAKGAKNNAINLTLSPAI